MTLDSYSLTTGLLESEGRGGTKTPLPDTSNISPEPAKSKEARSTATCISAVRARTATRRPIQSLRDDGYRLLGLIRAKSEYDYLQASPAVMLLVLSGSPVGTYGAFRRYDPR